MDIGWYFRRLRRMSAAEIGHRFRVAAIQQAWRFGTPRGPLAGAAGSLRWNGGAAPGPSDSGFNLDAEATSRLLEAAEAILGGEWNVFGDNFDTTSASPDWHRDVHTGKRYDPRRYCFDIPYRDADLVGRVKSVWEPSRLHHVTVLAAAYRLSGDERFALHAAAHLRSWWNANPPLRGIHWLSGIELGMRLVAWAWTRRLLADWPGVEALFERNPIFSLQLYQHERWLATLYSRGSSANNHLIAEATGLFVAATAFDGPQQTRFAELAAGILEQEIVSQTFPDGLNRELAFGYHGYVLGLFLVAALEGESAGRPMSDDYWRAMTRMADAMAANLAPDLSAPRQGDGDDAHALMLDAPEDGPWHPLLSLCAAVFGARSWWPKPPSGSVLAALAAPLAHGRHATTLDAVTPRPATRPNKFGDSGIVFLRDALETPRSFSCRIDTGPHGFLSTCAHGHADALSFELRIGGHPVLVDPGTYCYQGDPGWRRHFRSSIAHNTLEVAGSDQAKQAGPFLWSSQPNTWIESASGLNDGDIAELTAAHDGYRRLNPSVTHFRGFHYDRVAHRLGITDRIESSQPAPVRLAFLLDPTVQCRLNGNRAELIWPSGSVTMLLPASLSWQTARGETQPPLGWYSPEFGEKVPTTSLIGSGMLAPGAVLETVLQSDDTKASTS